MNLDIDGRRDDDHLIDGAISWRDGLLLALVAHLLLAGLIIFGPRYLPAPRPVQVVALRKEPPMQFVFVQPRLDLTTKRPKPNAPASDKDRRAQSPDPSAHPLNFEPKSKGNSPNKIIAEQSARAKGKGPNPEPQQARPQPPQPKQLAENQPSWNVPIQVPKSPLNRAPDDPAPTDAPQAATRAATPGGLLGDALQNLRQYVQKDQFDNQSGGTGEFGPAIQFDTKGVDFGPWIQRFIAQIRRNWFIPQAVLAMKGHVVLQFNVHKDGRITDLRVAGPSDVSAFNNAAYNALVTSNPTQPLPAAYPSEHAFFTVTFYYNETPPQ